jgi:hypothetical protein
VDLESGLHGGEFAGRAVRYNVGSYMYTGGVFLVLVSGLGIEEAYDTTKFMKILLKIHINKIY